MNRRVITGEGLPRTPYPTPVPVHSTPLSSEAMSPMGFSGPTSTAGTLSVKQGLWVRAGDRTGTAYL